MRASEIGPLLAAKVLAALPHDESMIAALAPTMGALWDGVSKVLGSESLATILSGALPVGDLGSILPGANNAPALERATSSLAMLISFGPKLVRRPTTVDTGRKAMTDAEERAALLEETTDPGAREMIEHLFGAGMLGELAVGVVALSELEVLMQTLRALAKLLGAGGPQVEGEIAGIIKRMAIALAVEEAVSRLPMVRKSDRSIGTAVHAELQSRYRDAYFDHQVVAERWNEERRRAEACVWGPGLKSPPVALEVLARKPPPPNDGFYRLLRLACAGKRLYNAKNSWLRADLIDRVTLESWEIKPLHSAASGVVQEAWIRARFNLFRFARLGFPVVGITGPLGLGRFIPPGRSRAIGRWAEAPLVHVLSPVTLPKAFRSYIAVPYQLSALPGLVCYVVVKVPNLDAFLVAFAAVVANVLTPLARRMLDTLEQAADKVAEEARRAAGAVVRAFLAVLNDFDPNTFMLVVFVLALIAAVLFFQPAVPVIVVGGVFVLVFAPTAEASESSDGPPTSTDISFGALTIRNFPVARVGELFGLIATKLDDIAKACIDALKKSAPEPSA